MNGKISCVLRVVLFCTLHSALGICASDPWNLEYGTWNKEVGFAENRGQIVDGSYKSNCDVLYSTMSSGLNVHLKRDGFSYDCAVKQADGTMLINRIDVRFANANQNIVLAPFNKQKSVLNDYRVGVDGVSGIPTFADVMYRDVWPNVDVHFTSESGKVEYNIVLHKGARVADVALAYEGVADVKLDANNIELDFGNGKVVESIPLSFVEETGEKVDVNAVLNGAVLGFETEAVVNGTLVIDPVPVLQWGTYFGGGANETPQNAIVYPDGGVIVSGFTESTTRIATSGAHQETKSDTTDAFVARFDSTGNLVWATYYGGTLDDALRGMSVDNTGNIYCVGYSYSPTGIASAGAFQDSVSGFNDIVVVKFDANGRRLWGTYFGGAGGDEAVDIAVLPNNNIVIASVSSSDGMTTAGASQDTLNGPADLLMSSWDTYGNLLWATYYGGNGYEEPYKMALVSGDEFYICGYTTSNSGLSTAATYQPQYGGGTDAFLCRFGPQGNIKWGTYIGGTQFDLGYALATDASGNAYVGGTTGSGNAIATASAHQDVIGQATDGFLEAIDVNGRRLWGTYYGGDGEDFISSIDVTPDGEIIVAGQTSSGNQRFGEAPAISIDLRGPEDGFLSGFDDQGTQMWSTYIGGNGNDMINDVVVWDDEFLYVFGRSNSTDFIGTLGTHQPSLSDVFDAFLMRIARCIPPTPEIEQDSIACMDDRGIHYTTAFVAGHTYDWSFPQEALLITSKDSNDVLVVWTLPGTYTISVLETSDLGCDNKGVLQLTVLPELRPDVQSVNGDLEACEGDTIFLKAQDGFLSYEWNTGDTTQILAVTQSGLYFVAVTDTACTGISDSVSIFINPSPDTTITGPASICMNGNRTVDYNVALTGGASYMWKAPSKGTVNTTLDVPTISVTWNTSGTDTLWVYVTSDLGCVDSNMIEVEISDSLKPVIQSSLGSFNLCEGDSTILDPGPGFVSYLWSTGDTTQTITASTADSFSVRVGDGSCFGTSDVVRINMSQSPTLIITGSTTICLPVNSTETYSLVPVDNDLFLWFAPLNGTIISATDQSTCTISWQQVGVDTVRVLQTTENGCEGLAVLEVVISDDVNVTITQDSTDLVANSVAVDEYRWLDAQLQIISGATTQRFTPTQSGLYYVEVRTGSCWSRSSAFEFTTTANNDSFTISDVDFGSLPVDSLINRNGGHVNEIIIVNTSQTDLQIDSALITGDGFLVPNQFPRLLRPGDTSRITVRFQPTEFRAYAATVTFFTSKGQGSSRVRGEGRALAPDERITEVLLQPDRIEVNPGEVFEVILSVGNEQPVATNAQLYEATMQWDARVLELVSTPEVFFRTTGREDNFFTAKIPEGQRTVGQKELIRIPFRAKLAEVDSTVLVFSGALAFRWKDDTKAYPACKDSVVFVRICKEADRRLITKRTSAQLIQVSPNPMEESTIASIDCSAETSASLELVNNLGISVKKIYQAGLRRGMNQVPIDLSSVPPGPYILRLHDGKGQSSCLVIKR